MTDIDLATVVERQRLDRMLILFPDEMARSATLAAEQAAAMAALPPPLPVEQAP